jgi:hypothetical protein
MPHTKSSQSNKVFSKKKSTPQTRKNNSDYQSLFLWVNFLWSLITLGMMNQRVEAQSLPATLDLAALTGTQGLVIQGVSAGDQTGWSVSSAGDVNGDGLADLLVGASRSAPLGRHLAGGATLLYGTRAALAILDLSVGLNATQGMVIIGAISGDYTGISVSAAGDVNGDGLADLVVGAYHASPLGRSLAGTATLIYGSRVLPATLDLATPLSITQGMVIQGAVAGDRTGISVSGAGDVNGDGLADLLAGGDNTPPLGLKGGRAATLIYGSKALPAALDLSLGLNTTQGMVILGTDTDVNNDHWASSAGDVNGDGLSDLLVGAVHASPLGRTNAGAVYIIYGNRALPAVLDLNTTLTQAQGMVIQGAIAGDFAGWSVSTAGDVNGDGLADILVGAPVSVPFASPALNSPGSATLIYGSRSFPALLDLNITLGSSQGMVIQGTFANDITGWSVSSAGDVNGDGLADFLVATPLASPLGRNQAGIVTLIYGSKALPAILELNATLSTTQGMLIQGALAGDETGYSVSGAGDINGDGLADFLVGALRHLH